jgi:hypothetical protein
LKVSILSFLLVKEKEKLASEQAIKAQRGKEV